MTELKVSNRTKLKRVKQRGSYDVEFLHAILDESKICHVASIYNDSPLVIPTAYWRIEDKIYFHGMRRSRLSLMAKEKSDVCISVAILDGIVFSASAFAHGMNYRSVMLFGHLDSIEDRDEKLEALKQFIDQLAPDRWSSLRTPTIKELNATGVFCMEISEASIKFREGPPADAPPDQSIKVYTGILPFRRMIGPFERGTYCDPHIETPDYTQAYGDYWVDD